MSPDEEYIVFIVNPISGYKKKINIDRCISTYLDRSRFSYSIKYTNYAGHGAEIARDAINDGTDILVAVGGDGTINEIVNVVANSQVKLGIIPMGSGNGLGRHVGIPVNVKKAIQVINNYHLEAVDTCKINGFVFVNAAGVGFDAYISEVFNQSKARGSITYIKSIIKHFYSYTKGNYEYEIDGETCRKELLTIAFANSQQYGNNAYVAPEASIKDGWLDVVFVSGFPFYYWPVFIYKTLAKKLHTSSYIDIVKRKEFHVRSDNQIHMHVDGDFRGQFKELDIYIQPKSLQLIVGRTSI